MHSDFFRGIKQLNVQQSEDNSKVCTVLHCCPVRPSFSVSHRYQHLPFVHSELGEAAESMSSISRSLGEDDCPPFTLFHFILLF